MHPVIAARIYPVFLRGEYDPPVFQAFREIEVAVRSAGHFENDDVGKDLMRAAFKHFNLQDSTQRLPIGSCRQQNRKEYRIPLMAQLAYTRARRATETCRLTRLMRCRSSFSPANYYERWIGSRLKRHGNGLALKVNRLLPPRGCGKLSRWFWSKK